MIDLEKAKQDFLKYINTFDNTEYKINSKRHHSIRVMEISNQLAKEIFETEEQVQLATLIGLLHDIGRFEQYTRYRTFNDTESIDHSDYGAEILRNNTYIREYIQTDIYDNIILKAIRNHGKFTVEEGLTSEELIYARLVRDADKLDILYEAVTMFWENDIEEIENGIISEKIEKRIQNKQLIKREKGMDYKKIDQVISTIAFIYDINFKRSFQIIKQNDYINQILNRFDFKNQDTKQKVEQIRKSINQYIEEKINQ